MDFKKLLANLGSLPPEEQRELLKLVTALQTAKSREEEQRSFMAFVRRHWPTFISGRHHQIMAEAFEEVASGKCKRLIINMPPRHTKSEFASYLLPAWFLGLFPNKKVIQSSHTADLAVGFGRKVRDLVSDPLYQKTFPTVSLKSDSAAAGHWHTNKGGEYFAIGVGGKLAGRGADLLIIDDPHSEQDALTGEHNPQIYDDVYGWYTGGPRQRLQPNGAIVLVMTRWSKKDLTGQIIKRATQDGTIKEWKIIEFPAIFPETGNILWPEFWSEAEMLALRDELPKQKWNAQYQQNPTSEESAILKREYWKLWEKKKRSGEFEPPEIDTVLISVDTAFEKTERANYSAFTVWGKFQIKDEKEEIYRDNVILLDAFKGKWEFPELKSIAKKTYEKWKPDIFLVEKKSAGSPLIAELRAMGIWASEYTPTKGKDKITRAQSIAPVFEGGIVWAPEEKWAEDVIEECSTFPNGDSDDYVDTVTQALIRFRQGKWIAIPSDVLDDLDLEAQRTVFKRGYHL